MGRVLVTGATGFVGRAVIAALAKRGCRIRAAVRRPPQPPLPDFVEIMPCPDLARQVDWRPFLEGMDQVIHLAGIAHTGSRVAPDVYDQVNRRATADLAAASARAGTGRFVFVSSIRAQSGPSAGGMLTESDPALPVDPYGRSKLAAEAAVRSAGVEFAILRPVLVYGPGVKGNFALLLRAALSPLPLPVGNLANRRSLLGIDNLTSAVDFVLSAPAAANETFVVADPGMPLRVAEVMETLRRAQGRRPLVLPAPTFLFEIPLRMFGRADLWERFGGNLRADSAKLIGLGWTPVHDTRDGLTRLLTHKGADP